MSRSESWRGAKLYTIGHSTRTLDELVALLKRFDISVVADIRTIPRSRRNPQFNVDSLRSALPLRALQYTHLPELGGLRRARRDSPNSGWRNQSFRGFADYMMTGEFEDGLAKLRSLAVKGRVALMCAEAAPWRCHRSLVADSLTIRGALVEHVTGPSRSTPHRMTEFAEVRGLRILYRGEDSTGARLVTRSPFHLEATVRVLQRRPANRVEVWERDRYLRVLRTSDGIALAEVRNHGTLDEPDVRISIRSGNRSAATRRELGESVRKTLGLDVDPEPLRRLAEAAPRLRPTALALRGMRPPRFAGWFESFANVVPFQQVSLESGVATTGRLAERFGESLDEGARRFHTFPTARSIAEARLEALRECGLSSRKAESLRSIARAIESGTLTEEAISSMSTKDALRTLEELPGIGPWSAALVLLRGLGRLDLFPPGDVGAERGLRGLMRLGSRSQLGRIVERFGDCRGYLYFCALGGGLLEKGLIHGAPPSS